MRGVIPAVRKNTKRQPYLLVRRTNLREIAYHTPRRSGNQKPWLWNRFNHRCMNQLQFDLALFCRITFASVNGGQLTSTEVNRRQLTSTRIAIVLFGFQRARASLHESAEPPYLRRRCADVSPNAQRRAGKPRFDAHKGEKFLKSADFTSAARYTNDRHIGSAECVRYGAILEHFRA